MADDNRVVDFTDLRVQSHWYKLRDQLEHELNDATGETRRGYDVSVKMNSATIVSDGDRSMLRVPISARWRTNIEQTIAILLVNDVEENDPRISAIAHGVAEVLEQWVQREIPVRAAPVFLYPESEVRWPEVAAPAAAPAAAEQKPAEAEASA